MLILTFLVCFCGDWKPLLAPNELKLTHSVRGAQAADPINTLATLDTKKPTPFEPLAASPG